MNYSTELHTILDKQTQTIQQHRLANGERVWVRRVGKSIPQWRYRLLALLAKISKLGALQPVPNIGGSAALKIEAQRLQQLAQQHIPVPRLLAQTADGIMFSHLGQHNLLSEIEHPQHSLQAWQDGLSALYAIHQKGAYLSQAFARNIIRMDNQELGFIDFEDDPAPYMSLADCQVRDYLCFLQSTAVWLQRHGLFNQAIDVWQNHALLLPEYHLHHIHRSVKKIGFLRHFQHRMWGNDTLRLSALANLFHQIRQT